MMSDSILLKCSHACTHRHARTDYKMAPRFVRERIKKLCCKIERGVIDIIASDHAPHGCMDKDTEFEIGGERHSRLQTTVPLMLELVHQKSKLDR